MREKIIATSILTALSLVPAQALAQRTTENAALQSGDAFGLQIGSEKTGLYSSDDVRGFDPVDAGNARIEGLYYDQIDRLPQRIVDGSSVKVGISAQRIPFPAPTGLVDYTLTKPSASLMGTADLVVSDLGTYGGSVEFDVPLAGESVGLYGGIGARANQRPEGGGNRFLNWGATLAVRPYPGAEILLFGGLISNRRDDTRPTIYVNGDMLPPEVPRSTFLGQPWAKRSTDNATMGMIAKLPLSDGFRVETALFHNRRDTNATFADLLSGVHGDGTVDRRTIIADGGNVEQSLSGEFRLVKSVTLGAFEQQFTASVRGRHKQRLFGGGQRIDLGPSNVLAPDIRAAPPISLGPKSHDDVHQLFYGLAYSVLWAKRVSFDFGLSKTNYRKEVDFVDSALADLTSRDNPLLWNLAAAFSVSSGITAYLGASRGMEEALVAPDNATNRSEAPSAIRTSQIEGGVKIALTDAISFVAGAFKITKPYYGLDPNKRYRDLGEISIKGLEFSLTGQIAPGLTLVGGTVLLDPRVSVENDFAGVIGLRPVGQVRRRSVVNLDWRPSGGSSAWSFDLSAESFSSRMANAQNTLAAPGYSLINLGARYRFELAGLSMLLRPRVENLFDTYGWKVSQTGGFNFEGRREVQIQLLADF